MSVLISAKEANEIYLKKIKSVVDAECEILSELIRKDAEAGEGNLYYQSDDLLNDKTIEKLVELGYYVVMSDDHYLNSWLYHIYWNDLSKSGYVEE